MLAAEEFERERQRLLKENKKLRTEKDRLSRDVRSRCAWQPEAPFCARAHVQRSSAGAAEKARGTPSAPRDASPAGAPPAAAASSASVGAAGSPGKAARAEEGAVRNLSLKQLKVRRRCTSSLGEAA